jgi:hypothetical protein
VKVERSKQQVRLILHGAGGRPRWREMEVFGSVMPGNKSGDDLVEFGVPMTK